MFIDYATVYVKAGNGGRGITSFRTEKFIDRGGPDGGDGGKGGDVIFEAKDNTNTLANFRYQPRLTAEKGQPGTERKKHGKNGLDTVVGVPVGTQIFQGEALVGDLTEAGQQIIIAKGGKGGFGNSHFKSSTRQAPRVSELGVPGEEFELTLELKLVADVGLVGLPNAGKSTLLREISNAKPKVADYPFTTLVPNLGVAALGDTSLVIADIPGLIEGASEGKGLGDEFLRHVERTGVLLHLIDVNSEDVVADWKVVEQELANRPLLTVKHRVIGLTKIDMVEKKVVDAAKKKLEKATKTPVLTLSAVDKSGIKLLLGKLQKLVIDYRTQEAKVEEEQTEGPIVYKLEAKDSDWRVARTNDGYAVEGKQMENFGIKTDANEYHAMTRLHNILQRKGVLAELEKLGYTEDQDLLIGEKYFNFERVFSRD